MIDVFPDGSIIYYKTYDMERSFINNEDIEIESCAITLKNDGNCVVIINDNIWITPGSSKEIANNVPFLHKKRYRIIFDDESTAQLFPAATGIIRRLNATIALPTAVPFPNKQAYLNYLNNFRENWKC